jgi:hypothetical protein
MVFRRGRSGLADRTSTLIEGVVKSAGIERIRALLGMPLKENPHE